MESIPTISDLTISLIALDRPQFLATAIQSLVETTPPGATLQLTFNSSNSTTRKTGELAASKWDGPTSIHYTDERLGFAEAHNLAVAKVSTPYVNFMGDDDVNLAPRFELQLDAMKNNDVLAVGTYAYRVGNRPGRSLRKFGRMDIGPTSRDEMRAYLEKDLPIYLVFPSVVARVDAIREIGGLRPIFGPAADIDLWTRLAERGTVIAIPERLFGFRVHDKAGSTTQFFESSRLARYAAACLSARRKGDPEPEYSAFMASRQPIFERGSTALRDRSMFHFRCAGAAWLERRFLSAGWNMLVSLVSSPPAWGRKLNQQFGRRPAKDGVIETPTSPETAPNDIGGC